MAACPLIGAWADLPVLHLALAFSPSSVLGLAGGGARQAWLRSCFLLPGFDGSQGYEAQENLSGGWVFFQGQSSCLSFTTTLVLSV